MGIIPINIAEHVGRTPMVQLTRLLPEGAGRLFAKLGCNNRVQIAICVHDAGLS